MTIGERIKYLREKNKMTQTDIAEKLNVATQTIFKYEKDIVSNIPTENIEKLAEIFGVTPSYLIGWDGKTNSKATVGERIRIRRKELGMSVDTLAEKIGKNRATVYRYEGGEVENVSIVTLTPLANALRTTPAYLMGWEDKTDAEPQTTLPRQTDENFFLTPTQKEILSNCQQLNDNGQKKVLDFSYDLLGNPAYASMGKEPGYKLVALGGMITQADDNPPIEEKIIK